MLELLKPRHVKANRYPASASERSDTRSNILKHIQSNQTSHEKSLNPLAFMCKTYIY